MGRILVVDDDPDILKLAERVLSSAGHVVLTATDVLRALDLMNRIQFDMLISDANMPHYNGFDLVTTVRKNEAFKNMSVAMLTGLRERKHVERAVQAGVDDYIVKPIDPMLFVQKVAALFEKRPPARYPEIHFSSMPEKGTGTMSVKYQLESISELGIVALTEFALRLGDVIDIDAPFFQQDLGVECPQVKVMNCDFDKALAKWRVHFNYLAAREAYLQKVRKWLHTHGLSNKGAA